MRIVSAIDRPLADEHVIAVDPPLRPDQPGVWRRRINPFIGRSLSDRALSAEQDVRSGMQRLRGQSVTAGIVQGLDVLAEPGAVGGAPDKARLHIMAGLGLTQDGEDVILGSPRSLALADLPVRARVDLLDAIAAGGPAPADTVPAAAPGPDALPGGALAGLYPLLPRRMALRLGDLLAAPAAAALPRVAVLVAQPVTATILASPRDACPADPRDDPYDDLQLIDGLRLTLDFWPSEMTARAGGPDYSLPTQTPAWRNRLAWRVFGVERAMLPGEIHPWEQVGTPLALIGFNPDWTLAFIDRASVVRLGGAPNPRTPLVRQSGTPVLWQARIAQLAEAMTALPDLTPATLVASLRQLPPVGFLPADVLDLPTHQQFLFPAGFGVSLRPIPSEELDLVAAESAALVPYSLDIPDEVEILVPVPAKLYEPGLLQTAYVDPAFTHQMALIVADRSNWLIRRETVRRRRDVLTDAVTGHRRAWSTVGDSADEMLPDPLLRAPAGCTRVREVDARAGMRMLKMLGAGSALVVDKGDTLWFWVRVADDTLTPQGTGFRGFRISLASATTAAGGDFSAMVQWTVPGGGPPPNLGGRANPGADQGPPPAAGNWIRLDVPVSAGWNATGGGLAIGTGLDGLRIDQQGGVVQYGPFGKTDASGNETVWIADDAPPGAILSDTASPNAALWPQVPAGPDISLIIAAPESDYGTTEAGGVRSADAVAALKARWPQPFLAPDLADLDENGLDGFTAGLDARLKATNDAVDLGFVRARADIYRVRQFMLGADAASRLVTSPSLADLATREESARAKSLDIADYLQKAYSIDFNRDPANPLAAIPKRSATASATTTTTTSTTSATSGVGVFGIRAMVSQPNFELLSASAVKASSSVSRSAAALSSRTVAFTGRGATAAVGAASLGGAAAGLGAGAAAGLGASTPGGVATTTVVQPIVAERLAQFQTIDGALGISSFRAAAAAANRNAFKISDVQFQTPLPSAVERTASVAERLVPAPAVEAHGYAIASKIAVLTSIAGLIGNPDRGGSRPPGIALADLPTPGFALASDPKVVAQVGDIIADLRLKAADRKFTDLDDIPGSGQGAARHEADYFTAAVRAIDNSIALMRLIEARIDVYNRLLGDAHGVRDELAGHVTDADVRLRAIAVEIEEARQDASVAQALLAEEQDRVAALNAQRGAILARVDTVMFRRPRVGPRVRVTATAPATAALDPPAIIACAREHPQVPEELHSYAALLRQSPVSWYPALLPRLHLIDRLDTMRQALLAVAARAAVPSPALLNLRAAAANANRMLQAVHNSLFGQWQVLDAWRNIAAQLDAAAIAEANLANARRVYAERAALADLIAGDHNRAILASEASALCERIAGAAACLHAAFGDVPPAARLIWAETLSEFDTPAPLRRLAGLPGWPALAADDRKTQQGLVDWLFGQIDTSVPAAVNAINELVRVCILLAAHAPVDRLVRARLTAPTPVRIGGIMLLAVDAGLARTGMTALIRDATSNVVAHGIVEDIADGIVQTRIVRRFGAVDMVAAGARIDLSDTVFG